MNTPQQGLVHKLPPKLVELFKNTEKSSLVGFGKTKEQQDHMLLMAVLSNQNSDFYQGLKKDLTDYFATLSEGLSVDK